MPNKSSCAYQIDSRVPGTKGMKSQLRFAALLITVCCALQLSLLSISSAAATSASFVRLDATTQGNWQGIYGTDGYFTAGGSQVQPSYGSVTTNAQDITTWASSTTDVRALQTGGGTGRIAAAWFVDHFSYPPVFSFTVNLTDGNTHQFALYALDWDNEGRAEEIQILDSNTNAVLDTRYISHFSNGLYLVWNVSGAITVNVITTVETNSEAVASGVFLGSSNASSASVSVVPSSVGLNANQAQQFTANVSGVASQNVTWSINPSVGTMSGSGIYTAPSSVTTNQAITIKATSATGAVGTATVNLSTGAVANFQATDTSTQGNWYGSYGIDGFAIPNDSQSIPSYASFAVQGQTTNTWVENPSDSRALQTGNGLARIASNWSSASSFSFDVNITDGQLHPFALYALDWDAQGRAETVQVQDANTHAVLDNRSISNFSNGIFLLWNVSGHVTITITATSGPSAVMSGAFWGHGNTVNVVVTPATAILGAGQTVQFSAVVNGTTNQNVVWSIASGPGSILTTGLYAAPSTLLNSQTVTVTATSATDPTKFGSTILSLTTGAAATFVKSDTTTQGAWIGTYGSDGYAMLGDLGGNAHLFESLPSYATFAVQQTPFINEWAYNVPDPRPLESANGVEQSIGGYWNMYNNHGVFYFDVNFTDGNAHQLALYAVDWNNQGRDELIQILDATTGAILDTRSVTNFSTGIWMVWNVYGHVTLNITEHGGPNAVVSGLFFGGNTIHVNVSPGGIGLGANRSQQFSAAVTGTTNTSVTWSINPVNAGTISGSGLYTAPSNVSTAQTVTITATSAADGETAGSTTVNLIAGAAATFIRSDTSTEGSWHGIYGSDGYAIADGPTVVPSYTNFSMANQSTYVWATNTGDNRALQSGSSLDRNAATWVNNASFSFDVNLTDGTLHQIAVYALDWDNEGRSENIQVVDANTGAVLDSRSISAFSNGIYLIWSVSGQVKINVVTTSPSAAVASGIFWGGLSTGSAINISVTPQTGAVGDSQTEQFTATVTGTSNTNVSWSLSPNNGSSGSISSSGLYAAPASIPSGGKTVTIIATSAADGSTTGSATLNLSGAAVVNFLRSDVSTQGDWHDVYGADGYAIASSSQSIPTYATFNLENQQTTLWAGSTSDPRALLSGDSLGRIASAWSSTSNFTFSVNFTDGNSHEFGLYAVDWDNQGRSETIQIIDPVTNAVLDTRTISNFFDGIYLAWNISGNVNITITTNNGTPAVISGVFWGGGTAAGNGGNGSVTVLPLNVSLEANQSQQLSATVAGSSNQNVSWSFTPAIGTITVTGSSTATYKAPSTVANGQGVIVKATSAGNGTTGTARIGLTTGAVANFSGFDTTTQGNWTTKYGTDGYSIAGGTAANPSYGAITVENQSNIVWASSTTDPRALQTTNGRVAEAWANGGTFSIDLNLTDGNLHQVALYSLDWDSAGGVRAEEIQMVDANSGAVLDSVGISNFTGGIYLVWNIAGHVVVNITTTAGANGVVSGVFLGNEFTRSAPVVTWPTPSAISYGTALGTAQLNATASVAGTFIYSPTSGAVLGAGNQMLLATFVPTDATDFTTTTASVQLQVNQASPTIVWPTPAAIPAGTALSSTQLNATSPVAGSFTYSPNAGTVLSAGNHTLTATFQPTDTLDYQSSSANVTLSVQSAGFGQASFLKMDTTTQGSWPGVYGADGYAIAGDSQSIPSYATFSVQNQANYTWVASTTDPRALITGNGSTRIAATWFNNPTFTFNVNITDGNIHQLEVYTLDWDSSGGTRAETVQIVDANTNAVLSTAGISDFTGGIYLVWNVSGNIKINLTVTGGANAVASGVFFGGHPSPTAPTITSANNTTFTAGASGSFMVTTTGYPTPSVSESGLLPSGVTFNPATALLSGTPASNSTGGYPILLTASNGVGSNATQSFTLNVIAAPPGATAAFLGTDAATQGNWIGTYGGDGYAIPNGAQSVPSYATFSVSGQSSYTWAASTADLRAPQTPGGTGRMASVWYSAPSFTMDVNLKDGNTHQVALYALDWDPAGRAEQIQVLDANSNAVLDTRNVTGFQNGQYLVWNINGHVKIVVTTTNPNANAAISGVFFESSLIGVSVTPQGASLSGGQTQQYTAQVTGTPNKAVTWSISNASNPGNPAPGSISSSGLYTAPASVGSAVNLTVTATASDNVTVGTAPLSLTAGTAPSGATATYAGLDTTTQGSWIGTYGGDGYTIPNGAQNVPSYATFSVSGQSNYTWAGSTADVRALQTPGGTSRMASLWFNAPSFTLDVNLKDGNTHQVALYALDWDGYQGGRAEQIQVLDASTNNVLDTRNATGFQNGQYLVWNINGHVKIVVTTTNSNANAAISGVFFESSLIGVSVTPQSASLSGGQTQQYTAQVTGTPNKAVTWSISNASNPGNPAPGSISSSGLYTAPASVASTVNLTVTATASDNVTVGTAPLSLTAGTASSGATATYAGLDTTTQGSWIGTYGGDGYAIPNGAQSVPSYANFSVSGQSSYTWAGSTTDARALQTPGGASRMASLWFNTPSFTFDVNLQDGNTHQVALYALDWDNYQGGRAEQIQILDASTNNVLDTRSVTGFQNGQYLVWNINGHVKIIVTTTNPNSNGAISGIFWGGAVSPASVALTANQQQQFTAKVAGVANNSVTWSINPNVGNISMSGLYTAPATISGAQSVVVTATNSGMTVGSATVNLAANSVSNSATFVRFDTTTQGNWQSTYGSTGYSLANGPQNLPAAITFGVQNESSYTWAANTTDPRALSVPNTSTGLAACWYAATNFDFDLNLTDGNSHQVAVYALDWDTFEGGRAETIQILDASTNVVLDAETIPNGAITKVNFTNGTYLVWNITGHVKINVVLAGGGNVVVSGIFVK